MNRFFVSTFVLSIQIHFKGERRIRTVCADYRFGYVQASTNCLIIKDNCFGAVILLCCWRQSFFIYDFCSLVICYYKIIDIINLIIGCICHQLHICTGLLACDFNLNHINRAVKTHARDFLLGVFINFVIVCARGIVT